MTTQYSNRAEWEKVVGQRHPGAKITPRGKQYRYAIEAIIPATWDRGMIPERKVGEFHPDMARGGGMKLPTALGRGTGTVED